MDEVATGFHEGERRAQALSGVASPSSAFIRPFMPEQHRGFFATLPYVVLGTLSPDGWPIATFAAGPPGFLSSPDETTLFLGWKPPAGDPVAVAIGPGAPIAVLGIEFATRRRNRANGVVLATGPDGVRVRVLQSFGNCPQYIRTRDVLPVGGAPGPVERLSELDAEAHGLIAAAATFFVASCAPDIALGGMDVSHRGGPAGFVHVNGDIVTVPDYPGNRYFNTLGNFLKNQRAGLMFIDFASGDVLHVGGTVSVSCTPLERSFSLRVREIIRRRRAVPFEWSEGPQVREPMPRASG
ncbi:flavohemoprotein [Gluconacetobacter sacchari DSM 12717]|uniref:Pyridoxamine 5'-phosphate oxidase n=2 Tax=Gluconacetobacter sacchari TaxID=92759 RepID=A0A7W4IDA5_9PROT|nr:pyridoxamine 5'-phosphate oxidase family protein [Gluconacetobacter sacchari]MBB2160642.1 pyridoxamine 5'-phosphate oxidase [Gluconacetobacter sacchari]GBQ20952.1 flavohemoprotein [Gluconacetobacter sacchari DSM 12717]